jgi:hypothetical protein
VSSKQPVGKRCEQHTALFVRAGMAANSGSILPIVIFIS